MTTIDAATRMTYVDGELDEITRRRVERAMAEDPALAEAVARDRALREALRARFAPYAEAPVPDRFRSLLGAEVEPITAATRRRRIRPRLWIEGAAIAATLVLGIAVGRQLDIGPVESRHGALIARGHLSAALDTQLASTQPNDAPVRIGLTFRVRDGAICRTFSGQQLQGIACRDGPSWNLVRTATGERPGAYRQAASGALATDAQAMMAGSPFSAAQEASARSRGWK